jgi:hypothetical protein
LLVLSAYRQCNRKQAQGGDNAHGFHGDLLASGCPSERLKPEGVPDLKRGAIFQIRLPRFRSLIYRMS